MRGRRSSTGWLRQPRGRSSSVSTACACVASSTCRSRAASSSPPITRRMLTPGDVEALENAVRVCRQGRVMAMFPEGTRRAKGLRKKHEPRPHTGAARIALGAGVPLVPAALRWLDRLSSLGPMRLRFGPPIRLDDLRELDSHTPRRRRRAGSGRRSNGSRPSSTPRNDRRTRTCHPLCRLTQASRSRRRSRKHALMPHRHCSPEHVHRT